MNDKTPPSLREQIIEAMQEHRFKNFGRINVTDTEIFDEAIMPVLQKAMDNGQLLVGRNTKDRVPVHKAVINWLDLVVGHVKMIKDEEAVISKRQLLKIIYQFGESAERAVNDARRVEHAPLS